MTDKVEKQPKQSKQALMPLDERKREILKAVITDYVMTAEPVGSKNLLKRHKLNYSSATVRNEMAELEELGYLEKPHTSAGRIPSDIGYRLYVDELIEPKEMSKQDVTDRTWQNYDHCDFASWLDEESFGESQGFVHARTA